MREYNRGAEWAFPHKDDGASEIRNGMDLREYLVAHSPVTFAMAQSAYGAVVNLSDDTERSCFFAIWALLQKELAEAQIREMSE